MFLSGYNFNQNYREKTVINKLEDLQQNKSEQQLKTRHSLQLSIDLAWVILSLKTDIKSPLVVQKSQISKKSHP